MSNRNLYKLLLIIPGFLTCILDFALTSIHQPLEYWSGQLHVANEANPLVFFLMQYSSWGIFVIAFFWLFVMIIITYLLPSKLSKIFCLAVLIGHSVGASSWLSYFYHFGYVIILVIINAVLFVVLDSLILSKSKSTII